MYVASDLTNWVGGRSREPYCCCWLVLD